MSLFAAAANTASLLMPLSSRLRSPKFTTRRSSLRSTDPSYVDELRNVITTIEHAIQVLIPFPPIPTHSHPIPTPCPPIPTSFPLHSHQFAPSPIPDSHHCPCPGTHLVQAHMNVALLGTVCLAQAQAHAHHRFLHKQFSSTQQFRNIHVSIARRGSCA